VLTEFGRTADENSIAGTDHGQAYTAFVMGAGSSGEKNKQVCYGSRNGNDGTWPGYRNIIEPAFGRHYLNPITDYRDIITETLGKTIAAESVAIGKVFGPASNYTATEKQNLDFIA
jgi:uncharacterized protein (DUF1501 family)